MTAHRTVYAVAIGASSSQPTATVRIGHPARGAPLRQGLPGHQLLRSSSV